MQRGRPRRYRVVPCAESKSKAAHDRNFREFRSRPKSCAGSNREDEPDCRRHPCRHQRSAATRSRAQQNGHDQCRSIPRGIDRHRAIHRTNLSVRYCNPSILRLSPVDRLTRYHRPHPVCPGQQSNRSPWRYDGHSSKRRESGCCCIDAQSS